jgi:hypothetical protein
MQEQEECDENLRSGLMERPGRERLFLLLRSLRTWQVDCESGPNDVAGHRRELCAVSRRSATHLGANAGRYCPSARGHLEIYIFAYDKIGRRFIDELAVACSSAEASSGPLEKNQVGTRRSSASLCATKRRAAACRRPA